MKRVILIIFLIVLFAPFMGAKADATGENQPIVKAKFSADSIMIGDQPVLTVTITKDVSQKVYFPNFEKNLMAGIEVLFQGKVDTTRVEGSRQMEISRQYVITSFDAGDYQLTGIPVISVDGERTDTIMSEPIHLKVNTYVIDTLTQKIYDVKPPISTPLIISEISDYIFAALLFFALAAIIVYIVLRIRNKEALFARPKLPPHVLAVSELQKIKDMELWQNGKHKEYFTLITDTVREYLDGRFGKNAMEMTTDEIMASIKDDSINDRDKEMLKELLSLADLVKFAKYVPEREDNEVSYLRALEFVEHTKGAEETPESDDSSEGGGDNKNDGKEEKTV